MPPSRTTCPPRRLSSAQKRRALASGPVAWRNWRAHDLRTRRSPHAFEVALYSDCRFVGELRGLGPYDVLNIVARSDVGPERMALAVRVEQYGRSFIDYTWAADDEPTTSPGSYHGGGVADEIASLLSLAYGVRLRAGEVIRWFHGSRDRGSPTFWDSGSGGYRASGSARTLLPAYPREVNLEESRALVASYAGLSTASAATLARAARQFQSAVWIADTDATTAWLQLVSAVETVAQLHSVQDARPEDVLASEWPDVARELEAMPGEARARLAALLAPQVRAARKYRSFLRDFLPDPPVTRPAKHEQVTWSRSRIIEDLDVVYGHRSTSLHAGVPFPPSMCDPPTATERGYAERPFGLGVGSGDAYWTRKDTPMYFHVYAHIVRGALCNWWRAATAS